MSENPNDISSQAHKEHVAELLNKYEGKDLKAPEFDVGDARIIVGTGSDGSVLVYEPEGFKEAVLSISRLDKFKYAASFLKDKEIVPYTNSEFGQSRADGEGKPQVVTLDEYKNAFKGIEVAIYNTTTLPVRGIALDMKNVLEDVEDKFETFKERFDHQKHLMEGFKLEQAFQPSDGMELEGDRYTTGKYSVDSVAIEIAGDEKGAIIHMVNPEEGNTGEHKDAFVYRTREEIEALRNEDGELTGELKGGLITSGQLIADMLGGSLDFHDKQDARSRILEMGINMTGDVNREPGVDFKEYMKGLEIQQTVFESPQGIDESAPAPERVPGVSGIMN